MKKEFTPEDVEHIRSTYKGYGTHLRWMLACALFGAVIGVGVSFAVGGVSLSNPVFWLGFVYGAAVPAADYSKESSSFREFLVAPMSLAKELRRRVMAIAEGRRALAERFADYY